MGPTTSYKVGREEVVLTTPNNVEMVEQLLFRFIQIPHNHHSTITVTFKNFGYNMFDHLQLLFTSSAVVAPRFEVHINEVCRA